MRTYFKEHYAIIILCIAIGALISAPSIYFRYFDGGYRGIDFFGSDAENHYLGGIQEIYDGHWSSGNIYIAEGKNDPYVQQPFPAIIVALLGKLLGMSSRDVNILTKFIFPAILTLIVYGLFLNVFGRKDLAILMAVFIMLIQATWIFLNPAAWLPFFLRGEFVGTDNNFISYARPVNPQISSIFFFAYLLCAWKFLFDDAAVKFKNAYGAAGAAFLGLTFHIYFFAFSFLSVFNAVLFSWFLYSKDWERLKKIFYVSIGALIIAIPYFVNVFKMTMSPFYDQLSRRTGMAETHKFIFSGVWWGTTALFLSLYRGSREVKIFILTFLATAFIVTNQQMITGRTLSLPAHYHWYYIAPFSGAIIFYLFFIYFEKLAGVLASRLAMLALIAVFFSAGFLYQETSYARQRDGFIYNQKYAPVLSWLDQNIRKESSIFVNEDLSAFIPVYTHHNVYYSGTLTDSLTGEERIHNSIYAYFYLDGVSSDSAGDFFHANRNLIGGRFFSDYYRQKNGCYGCFPDSVLDGFISEYRNFLNKDFVGQLKKYQIDYAVWDKEKNPSWRLDRFFSEKVYDKDNIIVYKV